jgi:hypothetical protein
VLLAGTVEGGAEKSTHPLAWIWREYGKADKRWSHGADPGVFSLELITVFLVGPLALLAAWAVKTRQPWRHILQAFICTCELYGGALTFFPEWAPCFVPGGQCNPNLSSDPIHVVRAWPRMPANPPPPPPTHTHTHAYTVTPTRVCTTTNTHRARCTRRLCTCFT